MAPMPYMPVFALVQSAFIFGLEALTVIAAGQLLFYARFRPTRLCVNTVSPSMTLFLVSMLLDGLLGMPYAYRLFCCLK
jgi:hypothetical protein